MLHDFLAFLVCVCVGACHANMPDNTSLVHPLADAVVTDIQVTPPNTFPPLMGHVISPHITPPYQTGAHAQVTYTQLTNYS